MNSSLSAARAALTALAVLATLGAAVATDGPIYICDGQAKDICGDKPPMPPGGLGWAGGPHGKEDDGGQANPAEHGDDDDMGGATVTNVGPPETACIKVSNSGGDLFGPKGGDQNGFWEGDCIEVKICWPYYRNVEHCSQYWGPNGDLILECYQVTEVWDACSLWVEVCPCTDAE